MDIKATLGKRVSARQGDFVTAQSNQATICKPWKSLATVVFGLLLSIPGLTQAQYRFIAIDPPGASRTAANGNSTHEIAGEFDGADGNTHGFVLNKGVFTTIDVPVPGAIATFINGINAPARFAGTYVDGGGTFHAFFKNNDYFTTLDPPGSARSQGGFINAQGQVVGTYRDATQKRHGFIWRNGTFTTFNAPDDDPTLGTVAIGINDVGEVVGDYVDAKHGNRHGFLRSSKGEFTTFDVPGAGFTIAEGINNAGTIVGAYLGADGAIHGFVLNNGVVFTTVDVPQDSSGNTVIFSINAKGEIVGAYSDLKDLKLEHSHGFLGVPVR